MNSKILISIAGILMLVVNIPAAHAIPVTWNLSGVTFDDGGIATGSFVYDADTNLFSSINVETSGGTTGQSHSYAYPTIFAFGEFPDFVDTSPIVPGSTANISLALVTNMTNAGGTIDIQSPGQAGLTHEAICADLDCNNINVFREIVSGSITTIPIPPAIWLFGSGLMGLAGMARRKASE